MAKVGNIGKWKAGKKVGGTPSAYTWSVGTWGKYTVKQGDYGWDAEFLGKGEVYPTVLVEDTTLDKAVTYAERDAGERQYVENPMTDLRYVPATSDMVQHYVYSTRRGDYHIIPSLFRGNKFDVQFERQLPNGFRTWEQVVDQVSPGEALKAIGLHRDGQPIPGRLRRIFGALQNPSCDCRSRPHRRAFHNPMEGPFTFRTGRVLYYDPAEGRYYDKGTDLYLDDEEAMIAVGLYEPRDVVTGQRPTRRNPGARRGSSALGKRLRDMGRPEVLGYELDREALTPKRAHIDTRAGGDYGADPLGPNDAGVFMYRMVPSGDVVDGDERKRRLARRRGAP